MRKKLVICALSLLMPADLSAVSITDISLRTLLKNGLALVLCAGQSLIACAAPQNLYSENMRPFNASDPCRPPNFSSIGVLKGMVDSAAVGAMAFGIIGAFFIGGVGLIFDCAYECDRHRCSTKEECIKRGIPVAGEVFTKALVIGTMGGAMLGSCVGIIALLSIPICEH